VFFIQFTSVRIVRLSRLYTPCGAARQRKAAARVERHRLRGVNELLLLLFASLLSAASSIVNQVS
jgi:hypothetical protein